MSAKPEVAILFASGAAANRLVAGIPAAARAVSSAAAHRGGAVAVCVPCGWTPSALCRAEIARIAPDAQWRALPAESVTASRWFVGALCQRAISPAMRHPHQPIISEASEIASLETQAHEIIAATGKAGDGIVSRYINRPLSRAATRLILRLPWARPWHATVGAGLTGLLMAFCLFSGTQEGLTAGALLFQAASVIDGIDGEMARATMRASPAGAMLDSLTDAATNIAFVLGVSYNLYASGSEPAGLAGAAAALILAAGKTVLAVEARRSRGHFTFDGLKHRLARRPAVWKRLLTYVTMRDFYALAACLLIIAGLAEFFTFAFALGAAGWLATLGWMMAKDRICR